MPHKDSRNLWEPGSDSLASGKTICRGHPGEKRKSCFPSRNLRKPHLRGKSSGSQIFFPGNSKSGSKTLTKKREGLGLPHGLQTAQEQEMET